MLELCLFLSWGWSNFNFPKHDGAVRWVVAWSLAAWNPGIIYFCRQSTVSLVLSLGLSHLFQWKRDYEQSETQEQQSHLQERDWEPMEAGMGRFELWVPGFRVVTVELDRVIDSSSKQGITRLRTGYQVFTYAFMYPLASWEQKGGLQRIGMW